MIISARNDHAPKCFEAEHIAKMTSAIAKRDSRKECPKSYIAAGFVHLRTGFRAALVSSSRRRGA